MRSELKILSLSNTPAYSMRQAIAKKVVKKIDLRLCWVSLVALVIIVAFNFSSVLITAMPFGYPKVKLVDMTEEQRAVCIMVIAFNLSSMFFVSCWYTITK